MNGGDSRGAKWMVYRFHTDSPVPFQKSFRMTIEHGHGNKLSNDCSSTAYWYQAEPHAAFPPFPPLAARLPRPDEPAYQFGQGR